VSLAERDFYDEHEKSIPSKVVDAVVYEHL
jgi:hypothetical protein